VEDYRRGISDCWHYRRCGIPLGVRLADVFRLRRFISALRPAHELVTSFFDAFNSIKEVAENRQSHLQGCEFSRAPAFDVRVLDPPPSFHSIQFLTFPQLHYISHPALRLR
jgi:hypothetical protein